MPTGVYKHKPCSKETKIKISEANKGKHQPRQGFQKGHKFIKGGEKGWFKKGQISPRKGMGEPILCSTCGGKKGDKRSKQCLKCKNENGVWNKGLKGIHLSPKSEFKKGHIPVCPFKKGEMSERQKGDKNSNWKGGLPTCNICGKILSSRKSKICKNCCKLENSTNWKGGLSKDKKWLNERDRIYRKNNKDKVTF